MTDGALNQFLGTEPAGGNISFASLLGTQTISLRELHRRAGRVARWLLNRGVRPGDRIGILGANSLDWVLLDLAALRLKVETAGFEPGKFSPTNELADRYGVTLMFTDQPTYSPRNIPMSDVTVHSRRKDLEGAPLPPARWEPKDVTSIKFTSGSTGEPKGLGATAGSVDSSLSAVQEIFEHGPGDNLFVFLPLSLLQQRYWIYSALLHGHDVTVSTHEAAFFAMPRVRPTVVMGVPAFYEAARRQIETRMRRAGGSQTPHQIAGTVFGNRIRYLWTGSAPAAPSTLSFFTTAGLPIYEGYGLNEACIVTKNHPKAHRAGSVGQALSGKDVLIGEDGVISVRSEHPVNDHYAYAKAGDSEKVFGPDGTVRTGDVGYLDEDGFLFIRGRADDVIVLDNGKKVVVRPVEDRMKSDPAIAECVLFCPGQTELVAVVSPASVPADLDAIASCLARTNTALSADEHISRVVVADPPFSIENGLLTSQYKPRRQNILDAYYQAVHNPKEGIDVS
ncbi:AMP-binding protein [Streptomyces bobili]